LVDGGRPRLKTQLDWTPNIASGFGAGDVIPLGIGIESSPKWGSYDAGIQGGFFPPSDFLTTILKDVDSAALEADNVAMVFIPVG